MKTFLSSLIYSTILEYATLYDEDALSKKCIKHIKRHTSAILHSEGFLALGRKTMKVFLSLDSMAVNEDELVDALLRWAEARLSYDLEPDLDSKDDEVFEGLFDKIRLSCLSEQKIPSLLSDSKPLHQQLGALLENLQQATQVTSHFSQPRLVMPSGPVTCDLIKGRFSSLIQNGQSCAPLIIETSEPILLHKIQLLESTKNPYQTHRIFLTIKQNGKVLTRHNVYGNVCHQDTDNGPVFVVPFTSPVEIMEGGFEISVQYRFAYGSYGTVHTGIPKKQLFQFGGLFFEIPKLNSTPIASLEFSLM